MMRKDNLAIIISSIFIAMMILIATVMFIVIGNRFYGTSVSDDTEASFVAENESEEKSEGLKDDSDSAFSTETQQSTEKSTIVEDGVRRKVKEDGSYSILAGNSEVSGVFLSDHVDLSVEDLKGHNVTYENSHANTVELLPSKYYLHEPVSKNAVATENFPASFCSEENLSITIKDSKKKNEETLEFPEEITLYNVNSAKGNSFTIHAVSSGEQDLVESVGWSTSDSSKLSLSKTSGLNVKVTRKSAFTGDMKVYVTIGYKKDARQSTTKTLEILVHVKDMDDTNTRLLSKSGVELFVDENGSRLATLSDYSKQDIFYGEEKITGWQTISGNTYYFNANNQPVTGEQYIGGLKYVFDDAGVMVSGAGQRGIDVSLYQKQIDWEQVAASGISFAIIRCGFRGAASGSLVEDYYFRRNIEGAKAAGLQVGVYFYTQARTEEEAIEEAIMAMGLCKNYDLDLPIFVDSENMEGGRANDLDVETRTRALIAFCETVEGQGYTAGVYASKYWYYDNVNAAQLEKYVIWVAQYATECDYVGKQNIWQYTSQETINGIEGYVDMNIIQ